MILSSQLNKYKLSRRGRKLQVCDDARTLAALPKDVPERTWAEILQKEENDLVIFDIREEIVEQAIRIGYESYMEKQNALFTAYCASQAWLKLIDWNFYRHDPGEEPNAYPPCFIPKRAESWVPDELPAPSPRDGWCRQALDVVEEIPQDTLQKWTSASSLDFPIVEDIPKEYWFPGKVALPSEEDTHQSEASIDYASFESQSQSLELVESEMLQRVTDYSSTDLDKQESGVSSVKNTTPVEGSFQGGGDSGIPRARRRTANDGARGKAQSHASMSRSRAGLSAEGDSRSRISIISDCRLRNLRLETQYEITSEKMDTPPIERARRK